MKIPQQRLVASIFLFIVVFASCGEDCVAPEISQNIVGTWETSLTNKTVEFLADGTLIDPDDAIYGVEINGVIFDQKTYSIIGTRLRVTVMPSGGGGTSFSDFNIIQNECDEIKFDVLGFTETLTRK